MKSLPQPPPPNPELKSWAWLFCLLLPVVFNGCQPKGPAGWQGYIEAEYVYVASPLAGTLQNLAVSRGQQVNKGDLLFVLEQESEQASAQEAERRWVQAKARLENLTKGKRPTEIASLEARLTEAKATLKYWEAESVRRNKLFEDKVISAQEWDQTRSQRDASLAQVAALTADLETARLGGRTDEIKAAEADVEAQRALLTKARWAVDQKTQKAPVAGVVQDTIYRPGEWVTAGNAIVVVLPPENLKVRFFVQERQLALMKPGQKVAVTVDGLSNTIPATISFISTQAEFTPPVIYSRETRAKLVYMVEAIFAPAEGRNLRPGQPADVRLDKAGAGDSKGL